MREDNYGHLGQGDDEIWPLLRTSLLSLEVFHQVPRVLRSGKEAPCGTSYTASSGEPSNSDGSGGTTGTGILLPTIHHPRDLGGGGWRAILDLKCLNHHSVYRRFKMHSLLAILESVRTGDYLPSVALTEEYLHVPILPAHRKFLHSFYQGKRFQYRALPFCLLLPPGCSPNY